ncbi:exported hypothetical protein [Gammaproteobacteria bacterium]
MNQRSGMKNGSWRLGCIFCLVATLTNAAIPEETVPAPAATALVTTEEKGATVETSPPAVVEEKAVAPVETPAPVVEEKTPVSPIAAPSSPAVVEEKTAAPVETPTSVAEEKTPASPVAIPSPTVEEKAPVPAETPAPIVEEKVSAAAVVPTPTTEELASLGMKLAKVEAERNEAVSHLEGIRADVDAIRQAQVAAETRATGLETDLRAARTRMVILEKNVQTGREQTKHDLTVITSLESKVHDAMDAARHCGETLIGSEDRGRAATAQIARLQQETQNLSQAQDELKGQLAEREEMLAKVRGQLQEREATLVATKGQLSEREETLTTIRGQLQEREETLTATKGQLVAREETLTKVNRQLQEREATLTTTQNQLVEREETLKTVQGKLQEQEVALVAVKDQLAAEQAKTAALHSDLSGVTKERDDALTHVAALATESAALRGDLEKTGQSLADMNHRYAALEDRYGHLTSTLAPVDGGTLDIKTARTQAAEAYNRYRILWEKHLGRSSNDSTLLTQVEQARHELFIAQYRVMRVSGGGELYIVRPRDSLSNLARLASRDGSRWGEVREANNHLLTNAGPLLVGTALVVP